jgi:hypothetical protein
MTVPRQPARTFQDLLVWGKAHEFVLRVYKFTHAFPNTEKLRALLEEGNWLLNAYSKAIQAAEACHSDSLLLAPDSSGGFL